MNLNIFDSRNVWHGPLIAAAKARGHKAHRVLNLASLTDGIGFIRPHPAFLDEHRLIDAGMRERLTMIQDRAQVEVYERKSEQFRRWGHMMPRTWLFTDLDTALSAALPDALVSKADEGASSVNVRVLRGRAELEAHARQVFGAGVEVSRCADGHKTLQRGYLLLQEFVPHRITWRVNRIGDKFAIFKRYCYPDRPVAQTGNVEPVVSFGALELDLLAYAKRVTDEIGSKWVAMDILAAVDGWKLLETSLAWPTTAGGTDVATFTDSPRTWGGIWDLLIDEVERGAFENP